MLEEQLRLATAESEVGGSERVQGHPKDGECLMIGDYHAMCVFNVQT